MCALHHFLLVYFISVPICMFLNLSLLVPFWTQDVSALKEFENKKLQVGREYPTPLLSVPTSPTLSSVFVNQHE